MSISLTTMRYFVEAAQHENFSEAANQLYTAQPNLSKKIAGLEKDLGVELFHREGRHVRLTAAGRVLYEGWSAALEQAEQSVRQAQKMERQRMDTLTLGVLDGLNVDADFLHRFDQFRKHHPQIQLRMEREGMTRLSQEFSAGRFDMIILTELQKSPWEPHAGCARQVLATSQGAIAINAHNPLVKQRPLTMPMLSGETFIVLSQKEAPAQDYRTLRNACRNIGFEPHIIQETDSIETIFLYVETGIGITVVNSSSRLAANPNIRLLPLKDVFFDTVAYWHTDPVHPAIQALANLSGHGGAA